MNDPKQNQRRIIAIIKLACFVLLFVPKMAQASLTVATENQQGSANTYPFTPTWTQASDSLIAGLAPSTALGNFDDDLTNRNVRTLTSGGSLTITTLPGNTGPDPIGNTTTSSNYVSCGRNGGTQLVYTLPTPGTYGYDLTNITVYGGWADNGRDALEFTVWYSTVADPTHFKPLTFVNYNPSVPGNTPTANRVTFADSTGSFIAPNVAAVMFDFLTPWGENNYGGVAGITVEGSAATMMTNLPVMITCSNELVAAGTPASWTLETDSLIAGLTPSAFGGGNFANEGGVTGIPALTDGTYGNVDDPASYATCGANAGTSVTYTLPAAPYGTDVTNIIVYSGWGNNDRDGQIFTVSYSTVSAPSTFLPITTVVYNPIVTNGTPSANRVQISMANAGALAQQVANIRFDFTPQAGNMDNGYSGYAELIVEGVNSSTPPPPPSPYLVQDTLPTHAETFVGDQVVLTTVFSNSPPTSVQWLVIQNGVTNTVAGATSATLTLNNVQITNSGSYLVEAVNSTNGAAAPSFSTAVPLVVTAPTTLGNVVQENSGQTGPTTFYPAWTVDTNIDLIWGFPTDGSGNPGTAAAGGGNYANESGLNGDPTILVDGMLSDAKADMVSCGWVQVGAGQSMTYTLPASAQGYDITNITVYGGWTDDGRNEQKYQVLYSTPAAPTTFSGSIGTFDYNPTFSSGEPNATRVTLVPAAGALAQNVYALQFNFNLQSKNNWNGYAEITVGGKPSLGVISALTQDITPLTAEDVQGSSLILTGAFTGALSYQWQKNGTNIPGATATSLTLTNLKLSDTATNGGYRLLAINAAGTNMTRGCAVTVDPVPAPVNNVVTAFAYQSSDAAAPNTFSPTWDTSALSSSLIYGQNPPTVDYGPGNFSDPDGNPASFDRAGGLPVLTDGNYGDFAFDGSHPAFATCGPNAGQYVVYSLGTNPNGYDVTNVQVAGGWNDNGRNAQYYTVSYSTVLNPTVFLPLSAVSNRPNFSAESVIRTTLMPAAGVLASNVYAIQVDFTTPSGVPNGYSGYSEVSVFGSPSANPPPVGPVITTQHEETNFDWVVETPNLIANQLPSSTGPGVFTEEGCNETNLTDGVIGFGYLYGASCGDDGVAVPWIVFSSGGGWNLTNIVVYTLWHDYGRDGQFYNLSYSTLTAPTTFVPLTTVIYNPYVPPDGRASGNRVAIAPAAGQSYLATNVYAVKFDFTPQGSQDFGWSGYSEIVLQGNSLGALVLPAVHPPYVSGGNLILEGTGGTPNRGYSLLTSTNLLTPVTSWTVSASGVLDGAGAFSNAIPFSATNPSSFFRLRMP
jgi:hypothetical protein